tara:strand:- start:16950 stop:17573 length:624 start_codon:yes stop_codon:yes gene_type:complete
LESQFILASASPRRKEILQKLNIPFDIVPGDFEENYNHFDEGTEPEEVVIHFSYCKGKSIAGNNPDKLIISADTIVVIDGKLLGKPKNRNDAEAMLEKLSNKTHEVFTGVSIQKNEIHFEFTEKTEVTFYSLSKTMINEYILKYPPFDKAGSYGIQDWSAVFVEKINGCFYNVVGFPLPKFVQIMQKPEVCSKFRLNNWLENVVVQS